MVVRLGVVRVVVMVVVVNSLMCIGFFMWFVFFVG